MVALCGEHHDKARAFNREQCREFKANGASRNDAVQGRFDWMRKEILGIAGGYFYGNDTILSYNDDPLISFNRDEYGHLLLNIVTPDARGRRRVSLIDNDWFLKGEPFDVESPPNGAYLKITYRDGDHLEIQFREVETAEDLLTRYPHAPVDHLPSDIYPLTFAEVNLRLQGPDIRITPTRLTLPHNNPLQDCSFINNTTAISIHGRP